MANDSVLFAEDPLTWLQHIALNALDQWRTKDSRDFWRDPLVRVAAADDPLFARLRSVVDSHHAMPTDLLPQARSVVVFFIPFRRELGQANHRNGWFAARSWAEAYVSTNQLIQAISGQLKTNFEQLGYPAVTTPPTHNFDSEKLVSRWSHKHLGYIAGLGTFGHHHLLITSAGACGRLGSLVSSAPLPTTSARTEEWCLVKAGRKCHACVAHCVYGALDKTRFDRHGCYRQCLQNNAFYADLPLTDVCGKCGCEVPCSYQAPATAKTSGDIGQLDT
jgi:epoxyqueuosine reductase QueG